MHLLYGGTFDPVHHGHLAIARAVRDLMQSTVWLMPAADPPHRPAPGASADDRLRMLELAIQNEPGLRVDRRELDRSGPSYTVDTLRELRQELGPKPSLALLLGADSFLGLTDWHDWQYLFALAHLVVAERPGSPLDDTLSEALVKATSGRWTCAPDNLRETPAGRVLRLRQPLCAISASAVRQRLADNVQWEELLPAVVAGHIRQHRLYQPDAGQQME